MLNIHRPMGTRTYPISPGGSSTSILPSLTSTRIGSPQSRHTELMRTVFPGKSQQTASDSNAHWPNHFCWPSMVRRNWFGRLLKGANDTMRSVLGYSQPGNPRVENSL